MVSEASSNPQRGGHLRLVGSGAGGEASEQRKHIQTEGIPALTPAEARAKGIREEAEAFRVARAQTAPIAESVQPQLKPPIEMHTETVVPPTSVPLEELGSRFEALAPTSTVGSAPEAERIDAALEALQASAPLDVFPELWPVEHLRGLASQDPSSAGRWLIALLPQLHVVSATALLDLRMASGQTIRAAALGDETRITWDAPKSRSIPFVKATEARLAEIAFGDRRVRRRQRVGASLLRSLAAAPISLSQLAASGTSVIDPYAFWQLVRIARPAVHEGIASRISHSDPARTAYDVTVDLNPGRPIRIGLGCDPEADAHIETSGGQLLHWAGLAERSAVGSSYLASGDADAELAALRAIGCSRSPIRLGS